MFNYRLKFLREIKGMSQKDIAKILGISNSRYNHYESEIDIIPIKYLIALCDLYEVSLDYIFCFSNNKNYSEIKNNYDLKLSGSRLKSLRVLAKKTLKEFSYDYGCSASLFHSYESGKYPIATKYLYDISNKYKISADYLMGRIDILIKIKKGKIELI